MLQSKKAASPHNFNNIQNVCNWIRNSEENFQIIITKQREKVFASSSNLKKKKDKNMLQSKKAAPLPNLNNIQNVCNWIRNSEENFQINK